MKTIKKAFTLVELVVVIAIIAILSAVSVVTYVGITTSAKESVAKSEASQLVTQIMAQAAIGGTYTTSSTTTTSYTYSYSSKGLTIETNAENNWALVTVVSVIEGICKEAAGSETTISLESKIAAYWTTTIDSGSVKKGTSGDVVGFDYKSSNGETVEKNKLVEVDFSSSNVSQITQ